MAGVKAAVDIGGTFTDVVTVDERGAITTAKLPTTLKNLADGFFAGLDEARGAAGEEPEEFLYGTTVAVNTLLEHRLPRIGLIVTAGFRAILATARLPAVTPAAQVVGSPAEHLVPLEFIREIHARIDADGTVRKALDESEVGEIADGYAQQGIAIVAVSLLHSYRDATHERRVQAIFARRTPGITVVLSSDVLPELREYERTIATCLNAALMPAIRQHITEVRSKIPGGKAPLLVMKSSGGLSGASVALRKPLGTALSGPSAAVVGMTWWGRQIGLQQFITLDIGGTSTDVALIEHGRYAMTTTGEIAGFPFKSPMVDVLTIGAGGGSMVSQGADGRWHVGPDSAAAEPGPVCYGRGGARATLTDAQLVLGRLPPALLGGRIPLDRDAAAAALQAFGRSRGLDAVQTAHGILQIASHNMCGALRRVSVLRGHDPRDYALIAIGGAGPLHAAELAGLLGIGTIVVPPHPSLAAAFGLLVADLQEDLVQMYTARDDAFEIERVAEIFAALEQQAEQLLADEGVAPAHRHLRRSIDMRYAGMSAESSVALAPGAISRASLLRAIETFHTEFQRLSGHSYRGREAVELVHLRVTAVGERPKPGLLREAQERAHDAAPRTTRAVAYLHRKGFADSAVYDRDRLGHGAHVHGPAVIEQYESTIVVPPECTACVDRFGNIIVRPTAAGGPTL